MSAEQKPQGEKPKPFIEPAKMEEIGLATVFGFTSGYALKKVGKATAFGVGLCFMGLQGLAHMKVIKIEWQQLEDLTIKKLDQDGDGKLTIHDVQLGLNRVAHNLATDLPSSAGFMTAFFLGMRYG